MKSVAKKKRPKSRKDRRAKIHLEGVVTDDATLCKKHGITPRTLQRWRKSLRENADAELSRSVAENKAALDKGWASQIPDAIAACLGFLTRAAKEASPSDPEVIHAIAGALKMIAETDGTYRMIDARISGQAGSGGATTGQVPTGAPSNVTPIRRTA